ncbi:TonB-dependent receptor [Pelomonas sp. CA6]|uniref:TonB-dependent receptor plug domain-containing protein n=1 Tax=Pelomonas sp. CA6 TaxID=2907999 RepID=UPI001F4C4163|nr:TonB-dependent receptor [Pelomonas sp. CA6]MCH7344497.1 TonB-dependent receptor [Pelomonas sp. CA6]
MSASSRRFARQSLAASRVARPCLSALALALLATPVMAQSQTDTNKLGQVLVTATRSKLDLAHVLADVTVLTRADIERQGFGNLADLLRSQSCFEFGRNGGPGTSTSMFLRGANTQHTLVLVDGVRMDTQSGSGGATWQAIPLARIERVEVVRGAASAVYGSDAVAGVVQIFTRKSGGAPVLEIGGGIGSLGTVKGDFNASGVLGAFDYSLGLATEVSDGFNSRKVNDPTYTPDLDGWRSHAVNGRLGWQLNKEHRFELVNTSSHVDSAYDATAKPAPGVDDRNLHDLRASRALWSAQWSKDWSSELSLEDAADRYETQTNQASTYLTETRVRNYLLHNSLKVFGGQLNLVLERREDRLANSSLLPALGGNAKRHQNAVAAGYLYSAGSLDAQIHLRHDRDSEFGGVNTGTVAAGWRFDPAWRVWASGGNAFRAPTLYQSFSEYGPKPGVAKLNPERGQNAELGLSWTGADSELSLTVYNNRVRNMISWDPSFAGNCVSTWGGCYGNLAKVRLRGISLKGETQIAGFKLQGSIDRQDPRDVLTDKMLGRRSRLKGSLRVEKSVDDWTGGVQLIAAGKRFDDNANKNRLGGYTLVNLDLGYRVNKQLRLQLNLDNLLDKDYETAKGYAQAPRTVFFGVRFTPSL